MDLHLEGTRDKQRLDKQRELAQEEGDDCQLILQLPDGSQHPHTFKLGATVAYVKLQVERLHGVPQHKQKLTSDGKALIDPLSLSDCPGISSDASCLVVVTEAAAS